MPRSLGSPYSTLSLWSQPLLPLLSRLPSLAKPTPVANPVHLLPLSLATRSLSHCVPPTVSPQWPAVSRCLLDNPLLVLHLLWAWFPGAESPGAQTRFLTWFADPGDSLSSSSWSLVVPWWVLPTHTTTVSLRVHGSALLGSFLTIWCCFGGYYPGLSRLPVPFPVVLRFHEPPISTEEQVRPLRVFMRVSTGGFSFFQGVRFVGILILCLSPKLALPTGHAGGGTEEE